MLEVLMLSYTITWKQLHYFFLIDSIESTIKTTNDCLNVGKFSFEILQNRLNIIKEVGDAVGTSVDFMTVVGYQSFEEQMKKLASNVEKLSINTREQFYNFKELSVDYSLYAEIIRSASTLTRFMQDTMNHPNLACISIFRMARERTSPLNCAYNLVSLLEHDLTSNERMKHTDNLEQWKNTVAGLLSQFLFIEAYSAGLLMKGNLHGPNILAETIEKLFDRVDGSGGTNKNNNWHSRVEQLVHKTQDNYMHLNNYQKADLLRDKLAYMFKNDTFYVVVFNDCDIGNNFAYDGRNDQFVCSLQRGLCNIIVYRSLEWKRVNQRDRDQFKKEVDACKYGVIPWWEDYRGFPEILRNDHIQKTGFVGLIRENQNVKVRSVNCDSGPGHWIFAYDKSGSEFILIAGFK